MCLYDRRVDRRPTIDRKEPDGAGAVVRGESDVTPLDLQQVDHEAEVEVAMAGRGSAAALEQERGQFVPVS